MLTINMDVRTPNGGGWCVENTNINLLNGIPHTFWHGNPWPIDSSDLFWELLTLPDYHYLHHIRKIDQIKWIVCKGFDYKVRVESYYQFTYTGYMENEFHAYQEHCLLMVDLMNEDEAMIFKLTWGGE